MAYLFVFPSFFFFFFNDTATTEIYTLSLHERSSDLKVAWRLCLQQFDPHATIGHYSARPRWRNDAAGDRKSTRLNSSHLVISYAVFCLKKNTQPLSPFRAAPLDCPYLLLFYRRTQPL